MGYLYENLPFGKDFVECPDLYTYPLFVYFVRADKFAANSPNSILALNSAIARVLPDVEDWQVSVIRKDHIVYRFHDPAQRLQARDAILNGTPVELVIRRVSFAAG